MVLIICSGQWLLSIGLRVIGNMLNRKSRLPKSTLLEQRSRRPLMLSYALFRGIILIDLLLTCSILIRLAMKFGKRLCCSILIIFSDFMMLFLAHSIIRNRIGPCLPIWDIFRVFSRSSPTSS